MSGKPINELEERLEEIEQKYKGKKREDALLQEMRDYKGDDEVISFQEWLNKNKTTQVKSFSSGFKKLDDLIEGFHEGDVVAITARSGQGKTTFCQNLTRRFSDSKIKTLWFSYEVPVSQFLKKLGNNIPDGYLPQVLLETSKVWIERKIVEGISKYNTKVVFIDHLHYLFSLAKSKSPSLEIGEIMRWLKLTAIRYNITIFIIAHTQKIKNDEVIGLDSIRDSSFVGQESDYVIALWRQVEKQAKAQKMEQGIRYKDESTIAVIKNRYTGQIGAFSVYYKDNEFYENIFDVPVKEIDIDSIVK